ncbi:hypothetical protein SDC9_23774 [bioreactor metagenome]|uniref:Uncharacterized protein n=1 Tax=bioreactor metagenome TaxID=1076179 RepID=A0A644UG41_9ZZZZ|nr:UPF0146 family protein [Methanocorpusculum sp.]
MRNSIETAVGRFIAAKYRSAVEVGFGGKTVAAEIVKAAGIPILCTDVHAYSGCPVPAVVDDCVEPDIPLYAGAEVIYAIRPGTEIIPPLISLAKQVGADLIVYHLGFELYENGGERIMTEGVMLHRYVHSHQE